MIVPVKPFYTITLIMLVAILFVAVVTHYFPPKDITEVRITISEGEKVEYKTTVVEE